MFANNEIGTIQPIKEIGNTAKKNNIVFHTDAVQAIGNIKIDVNKLNIDMLSLSGHKFYAPKGVGALYVKEGIKLKKMLDGGEQEQNLRAGTENVAEIVGLGKAIELIYDEFDLYNQKIKKFRDYYIEEISKNIKNIKINGDIEERLAGNANISFPDISGPELLFELDKLGICASAGSACSTSNPMPSHVLTAIGLDKNYANSTLRISFGKDNTIEDVDFLIKSIIDIVNKKNIKNN